MDQIGTGENSRRRRWYPEDGDRNSVINVTRPNGME
jgi:hypothetical protein